MLEYSKLDHFIEKLVHYSTCPHAQPFKCVNFHLVNVCCRMQICRQVQRTDNSKMKKKNSLRFFLLDGHYFCKLFITQSGDTWESFINDVTKNWDRIIIHICCHLSKLKKLTLATFSCLFSCQHWLPKFEHADV